MRAMKDSGIEWIGEIPEDWNVKRVKAVLCERNESNNPIQTDRILSLTNDRGVIPYEEKGDVGNKSKEDLTGYKLAYPGDIVLNSMNVFIGSVALSSYFGCVSPVYYMLYPRNKNDSVSFYNYLFQTKELQTKLHGYGNGIMEIRMRIQMSKLNSVQLPVPPSDVQQKIADYLDRKCSQIDAIIAWQQEVIEKLKAYKLSVITEAVTKGLNPHAPMKDSGDDFIGVMPKHWNVTKLGMLFDFCGGYAYSSDSYTSESDNQVVRIGNVKNGYMALENAPVYISDKSAVATDKFRINPGSILFTMTGTKGKRDYFFTHLVTKEDCKGKKLFLNQRVGCFLPRKNIDAGYYNYLLKEKRILDSIFVYETGTANQGNLGIESIRRTKVQLPSKEEQIKIREYLDDRCSRIECLLTRKSKIIYRLIDYKKSLIYEVITGKKEV